MFPYGITSQHIHQMMASEFENKDNNSNIFRSFKMNDQRIETHIRNFKDDDHLYVKNALRCISPDWLYDKQNQDKVLPTFIKNSIQLVK